MVRVDDAGELVAGARRHEDHRIRRQSPDRTRHQAARSMARSARAARGCSSRTPTSRQHGAEHRRPSSSPARRRRRPSSTDYQMCVHAIGDRANRETLNIFEDDVQGAPEERRTCAGASSTRSTSRRRYSAVRPARRDRVDAGRSTAPPTRRLCSARLGPQRAQEGAYVWQKLMKTGRHRRQRHRRAGRGRESAARATTRRSPAS